MKRLIILVLFLVVSASAAATKIKFTFDLRGYDNFAEERLPHNNSMSIIGDTDLWTLSGMTLNLGGQSYETIDTGPVLGRDEWSYNGDAGGWEPTLWGFRFRDGEDFFNFDAAFTEGYFDEGGNPVENFLRHTDSSWILGGTRNGERFYWDIYPYPFSGSSAEVISVPEPTTLSLLFLGLAAIGIRRRMVTQTPH